MATKVFPTVNDINGGTAGQGKTLTEANVTAIHSAAWLGWNYVRSSAVGANGGGLNLTVGAGVYMIAGYLVTKDAGETVLLTASVTNHVFLQLTVDGSNNVNGTQWVVNTTGLAPAGQPSVKVSTVVTGAATITTITDTPRGLNPIWTELPTNPVDGQEILYQTAAMLTDGIVWKFRYNASAAGSYKWHSSGSATPWQARVDANETTASAAYVALATALTRTVPIAGDYMIEQGGLLGNNTANTADWMSFAVGATAASDVDAVIFTQSTTTVGTGVPGWKRTRKDAIAASSVIAERARVNAGTGSFSARALAISPIRVG